MAEPVPNPAPGPTGSSNKTVSVEPGPVEALSPGDVFELKVFGENDLSGKFRVSGSGEVTLPLIGRVSVLDVGLTDFEELVTERLRKYLKQPRVHVFVEGFKGRKVYVFGRVMKPGTMTYENGMRSLRLSQKQVGFMTSRRQNERRLRVSSTARK